MGSVGPKFFEGMLNLIYLKRIKKKLQECKEFFWAALDDCKTDDTERRSWLENTSKYVGFLCNLSEMCMYDFVIIDSSMISNFLFQNDLDHGCVA